MALQLTSQAFKDGDTLPVKYTADGKDLSPPLQWNDAPADTQAYVLLCLDPDAPIGTFVHWVAFDIPAERQALEEGIPPDETIPGTATQGTNNFGKIGYGGPAPPPGSPHRYIFYLYAVDTSVHLPPGADKDDVLQAIDGHTLDETSLTGYYGR